MKWVKLGCTLLTTLLANPDGVRYLKGKLHAAEEGDRLLKQLLKGFAQLDPVSAKLRRKNLSPNRIAVQYHDGL